MEISSYYEDRVYEVPEIFHIIDDNITEAPESLILYSTICFGNHYCNEQPITTQIIIIDDDCKFIGLALIQT